MFKKTLLSLSLLTLSSCTMAPGMQMAAPSAEAKHDAAAFTITPHFIAITPRLIDTMPEVNADKYYYVGPQDVLNVNIWDHPEFSFNSNVTAVNAPTGNIGLNAPNAPSGFLINPDGYIYFPLIGPVYVQNKTADQIRSQLVDLLTKYIRQPLIDVRVSGYRSQRVYIMGEVVHSGLLNLTDSPLNLTDAINIAGGINQDTADPRQIYVIRGNMRMPSVYWLNAGSADALLLGEKFHLENNDIVFVTTAEVARWNRAINQIMPTIQTVFYTQASIQQTH